jgi:hypothetical protein
VAFQPTPPRFQRDSARPHTRDAVLCFVQGVLEQRVLSNRYLALFEEELSWPPTSPDLDPCDYFPWEYLKDKMFRKNPHTIPELKTAIQSQIEAISTEPLIKALNNVVLCLHEM